MILFGFVFFLVVLAVSPAIVAGSPGKPSATCPLLTEPVTIDGKWTSTTEWTDAPESSLSPYGEGWWRCKHDATYLYILVESLVDTEAESYVTTVYDTILHAPLYSMNVGDAITIQLDTRHNGGAWPSTDDYDFSATYVNPQSTDLLESVGNGKFWNILSGVHAIPGVQARINLDTENSTHPPHPHVTGEFKIPLSLIPGQVFGLYIIMTDSRDASKTLEWPPGCEAYGVGRLCEDYPDTWGDVSIQPTTSSPVTVSSSVTTTFTSVAFQITNFLNATGAQCLVYRYWYFPAQKGELLSTTIESNSSIDFYLLTKADYDSWSSNGFSCQLSGISSPLVNQTGITHYDLSITIPSDGTYYYVFINWSHDKAASVTYGYPLAMTTSTLMTLSSPVTVSSSVTTTFTPVTFPTVTFTNVTFPNSTMFVSTSTASLATSASVQTVSSTITTTQMRTDNLNASGQYCFWYRYWYFPAQKGELLSTTIESNSSIDFYVLTQEDYDSWSSNSFSCQLSGISSPLVNQTGITNYDLSITVPSDGTYYYVFINWSHDKAASVTYSYPQVMTTSTVVTLSSPVTASYVVTTSSETTASSVYSSVVTSESTVAETGQSLQLGSDTLVIILAAVVAALLGYVAGRRRGRITVPPPPPP
jgi:hypothetical protein